MKVIIIKDCKDGKKNDVVEVSNGYATNFLIKKGLALPVNQKTQHKLKVDLKHQKELKEANIAKSEKIKAIIEGLTLEFPLKFTNNMAHHSISRKQIMKSLRDAGIKVESHSVENVHIKSEGITKVNIKLLEGVEATLKVKVFNEN